MRAHPLEQFQRDGYAVVRGLVTTEACSRMLEVARADLAASVAPIEYEADTHYPGAPASRDAPGGRTVRRLLQAYARDPVFSAWATSDALGKYLQPLLGRDVQLSQAHHNCVMTKDPRYSS